MIILENRLPRLRAFEIPVALGGGEGHAVPLVSWEPKGAKIIQVEHRRFPTTLTLTAKGTAGSVSEPLPDSYKDAPQIAEALRRQELLCRLIENPAPSGPAATTEARPAAAPAAESEHMQRKPRRGADKE